MKTSTCIICLFLLLAVVTVTSHKEAFGMSPGTLTQLQSTSVIPRSRPYFLV
jgi:hypothetical protein